MNRTSPGMRDTTTGVPWWAVLVALFLAAPAECYLADQTLGTYRQYDASWQYDFVMQAADGRWAGRDFIFNFGPPYQVLHGLGLVCGGDVAAVKRFWDLPAAVLVTLGLVWLLRQTGVDRAGSAALLLAWAAVMAAPGEFRGAGFKPMWPMLLVAATARAVVVPTSTWRGRWLGRALWCGAAPFGGWYSFELGPMTLLAQGGVLALIVSASLGQQVAAARQARRRAAEAAAWMAAGVFCFLAPATWSPGWRRYLMETAELSRSYQSYWAWPGETAHLLALLLAWLLAACGAGLGVWFLRRAWPAGNSTQASAMVLGASAYGMLVVRYGLTRSDLFHVWNAVAPTVCVVGLVVPAYLWGTASLVAQPLFCRGRRTGWCLVCLALLPFAASQTFRLGWLLRWGAWSRFEPRRAVAKITDPGLDEMVAAAAALPGDRLAVWPYGALVNRLAGKRNPLYSILFTEAHNASLVRGTLAGLERLDDLPVVVNRDALPLDGFPHPTRTSEIFRWLLDHYELARPPEPHCALLARVATRTCGWQERPLAIDSISLKFPEPGVATVVSEEPARASDLIRLRVRAARTSLAGWRKPGWTAVVLVLDDGRGVTRLLPVVMDGQPHDFLVSCLDLADPLFLGCFAADRAWRAPQRVVRLQLGWQALDVLSRAPATVELLEAAVLERPTARVLESPWGDEQATPGVARWLYASGPAAP